MQDIRRGRAEGAPGGGDLLLRHDHFLHAELAGEDARVRRARAAEGEEHEVARIETLLHGRLADDVGHLELGDPGDSARRLHERNAERRCDALHRVHRLPPVELDAPAEKIVRIDGPEHDIGVGDGGNGPALAVADRPGVGARRFRAHRKRLRGRIDARKRPAARADRLDVDLGQEVFVLGDVGNEGVGGLPAVDDSDVERRSAHVGGDDVRNIHELAEVQGTGHARHRARVEREERRPDRTVHRDRAAAALRDLKRLRVAGFLQLPVQVAQVFRHHRPDVGVQRGRRDALVLAPLGSDIGRAADEQIRSDLPDHLLHALFVPRKLERPEKTHGDGLDAGFDQALDRGLGFGLVQRNDHLAEAVDALRHALDQALGHDRHRLLAGGEVNHLGDIARGDAARAAHDVDRVLVAPRRDQADARAFSLDQRVRADRGAVGEHRDLAAELFEREAEPLGRHAHRGEHALGEIGWGGRGFRRGDVAVTIEDHAIGESAADVHSDQKPRHFCSIPLG